MRGASRVEFAMRARKRFVNDPVAAHDKHATKFDCLRRKRRRMPSFTGGLNLNALEGAAAEPAAYLKSCRERHPHSLPLDSQLPAFCPCSSRAHLPNRRTCGEISSGGIIRMKMSVDQNMSNIRATARARGTFGRRRGGNSKKKAARKAACSTESEGFSIAR